jgi:hypothetical protein
VVVKSLSIRVERLLHACSPVSRLPSPRLPPAKSTSSRRRAGKAGPIKSKDELLRAQTCKQEKQRKDHFSGCLQAFQPHINRNSVSPGLFCNLHCLTCSVWTFSHPPAVKAGCNSVQSSSWSSVSHKSTSSPAVAAWHTRWSRRADGRQLGSSGLAALAGCRRSNCTLFVLFSSTSRAPWETASSG